MAFAARYQIEPTAGAAAPADDRREARRQIRLDAGALLIHDLSAGGFFAAVDGPPPADDRLTVDLPGLGPVGARIAWRGQGCFGAEFDSPLARGDLNGVLARARVVWADFAESRGQVEALAAKAEAAPVWDESVPPPLPDAVAQPAAAEPPTPDDRYPLHTRLRIIVAGAVISWILLVGLIFAVFG